MAKKKDTSYTVEMLKHEWNISAGLASLALGGVLSFVSFGLGAVPVACFVAADIIAALFVPSSASFRHMVDRRKKRQQRKAVSDHLMSEIKEREENLTRTPEYQTYDRMLKRIDSLEKIAANRDTTLSDKDVDHLRDATVDYLSMWLAKMVVVERRTTIDDAAVESQLKTIVEKLESAPGMPKVDFAKLMEARDRLTSILDKRSQIESRESTIEVTMLSMSDSLEELYQRVVADPSSADIARHLQNTVDKMKVQEEIEAEFSGLGAFEQRKKAVPVPVPHYA